MPLHVISWGKCKSTQLLRAPLRKAEGFCPSPLREGNREASAMHQKERFGPRAFEGLWDVLEQEENLLYPMLFIHLWITHGFSYQPQWPHPAALCKVPSDGFSWLVPKVQWSGWPRGGVRRPANATGTAGSRCCPWKHLLSTWKHEVIPKNLQWKWFYVNWYRGLFNLSNNFMRTDILVSVSTTPITTSLFIVANNS